MDKEKLYKVKDLYIKLSAIDSIKDLYIGSFYDCPTILKGEINGKEIMSTVVVSNLKPEYQWQTLKENEFYQEYTNLFKDFMEYNGYEDRT